MSDDSFEFEKPVVIKKGVTKEELKAFFQAETWSPTVPQTEVIDGLRKECYKLAGLITVNTVPSLEQELAVRYIWQAFQYAKLAVMLNVEVF